MIRNKVLRYTIKLNHNIVQYHLKLLKRNFNKYYCTCTRKNKKIVKALCSIWYIQIYNFPLSVLFFSCVEVEWAVGGKPTSGCDGDHPDAFKTY
jgi:hypothetical protein